jgi:hypothetical protein
MPSYQTIKTRHPLQRRCGPLLSYQAPLSLGRPKTVLDWQKRNRDTQREWLCGQCGTVMAGLLIESPTSHHLSTIPFHTSSSRPHPQFQGFIACCRDGFWPGPTRPHTLRSIARSPTNNLQSPPACSPPARTPNSTLSSLVLGIVPGRNQVDLARSANQSPTPHPMATHPLMPHVITTAPITAHPLRA